jgi:hypothetical protein
MTVLWPGNDNPALRRFLSLARALANSLTTLIHRPTGAKTLCCQFYVVCSLLTNSPAARGASSIGPSSSIALV